MFVGAISKKLCWQLVTHIPFGEWGKVFIGCSGSFRSESVIGARFPDVSIYSNDVSFLSCALGAAATGKSFPVRYTGELDFLEPYAGDDPLSALAAAGVALEYAACSKRNRYGQEKRKAVIAEMGRLYAANLENARKLLAVLRIEEFYLGDFRQQIDRAKDQGGGFLSFAPTYRGGYERLYKALHENIEWDAPTYDVWDPKQTPQLIEECEAAGIPYGIISDQLFEGQSPAFLFSGSGHPVYVYGKAPASLRVDRAKVQPFKYQPIDPATMTEDSQIGIVAVPAAQIAFLKSIYLSKGIKFKSGMANFLVLVDGAVVGGITYNQTQYGDRNREVYILSDFAIRGERRLAKLVALIATSSGLTGQLDQQWLTRIERVFTTAFTNKPVSMKYRGIFDIHSRKPGMINYASTVREATPQELYVFWWRKYGAKA